MNYQFLHNMDKEQTKRFLSYINDNLRRRGWLTEMRPIWKEGKKAAEERLRLIEYATN
jgi:hypothetical protein